MFCLGLIKRITFLYCCLLNNLLFFFIFLMLGDGLIGVKLEFNVLSAYGVLILVYIKISKRNEGDGWF